jgi:hypothetical protein
MGLDLNTLLLVTVYVEALLGLLLLFAWVQNSQIHGVVWWAFAHFLRAGSIFFFGMYGAVSNIIAIDIANSLLFTGFAVIWMGARVFDGRSVQPFWLAAGAVVWLLISRTPFIIDSMNARALFSAGIITTYTWLAAYEFWRGRSEQLVSRWPAIFISFAFGAMYLLHTPLAAILPWTRSNDVFASVWLTALSFEALLFTISLAFVLLAMAKERGEKRSINAARRVYAIR